MLRNGSPASRLGGGWIGIAEWSNAGHQTRGDPEPAESLYHEALVTQRRALGDDHPGLVHALGKLAGVLSDRGDHAGAERLLRESLEIRQAAFGTESTDAAEGLYLRGLELFLRERTARHPDARRLHRELADLYAGWGREAEAEEYRALATVRQARLP